jgi:hypothetical protein
LIERVAPAAWAELPRQVGYRQAIELVVKHAIEHAWNDALVDPTCSTSFRPAAVSTASSRP